MEMKIKKHGGGGWSTWERGGGGGYLGVGGGGILHSNYTYVSEHYVSK